MSNFIFNPLHSEELQLYPEAGEFDSRYLKLDQTTPQIITDGAPIFDGGLKTRVINAKDATGLSLFDDANNGIFVRDGGNVGIGTTSPLGMLDVGSGKLLVTSGGNVGIGTISPGAKLDILPSSSSDIVFRTKSLQSTAPLGNELVSNGDFSTTPDTSWTWGTGWTHDTTNLEADHTPGNTAALTQNISVTNGQTYQVEITIKNRTAGSVTLGINGVYIYNYDSTTALNSNATYQRSLVANITGSATLSITPTSDFNGSVDNITVKQITGVSQPNFALLDDAGSVMAEMRGKNSLGNIALGTNALGLNTTGYYNSAIGINALRSNTTGSYNSAIGESALYSNTTGYYNSAIGSSALYSNTTGYYNLAIGYAALRSNTTGYSNSAIGLSALYFNTTGYYNLAIGLSALYFNTTGYYNLAIGSSALYSNTTGYYNLAIGYNAGRYITGGSTANQTSNTSLYLGAETKAYANGDSNEIVIGYNTTGFGSNSAAYGNSSMTKHIFQAGNVGIGTTSPSSSLQVLGNIKATGVNKKLITEYSESSGTNFASLWVGTTLALFQYPQGLKFGIQAASGQSDDGSSQYSMMSFGSSRNTMFGNMNASQTDPGPRVTIKGASSDSTKAALSVINSGDTSLLYVRNDGNVGIGTTAPSYKLDVNGDVRIGTLSSGSTDTVVTHSSGVLQSRTIDSRVWGSTLLDGSSLTANYLTKVSDSNTLVNSLVFDNGTNVGIGTTSPSTKLDIGAGAMTLEAMTAPSSPASDKAVLFLEATGTSPSRTVALKVKWQDGSTSTLASVTV